MNRTSGAVRRARQHSAILTRVRVCLRVYENNRARADARARAQKNKRYTLRWRAVYGYLGVRAPIKPRCIWLALVATYVRPHPVCCTPMSRESCAAGSASGWPLRRRRPPAAAAAARRRRPTVRRACATNGGRPSCAVWPSAESRPAAGRCDVAVGDVDGWRCRCDAWMAGARCTDRWAAAAAAAGLLCSCRGRRRWAWSSSPWRRPTVTG